MILHLRETHGIDLTLGHHHHAPTTGEPMLPEEHHLSGITKDPELLISGTDLLSDDLTGCIAVLRDLNGYAKVLPDTVVP